MGIAPGALDLIKDDYSGYHHRTAYNSGYYPQAIYAGALIALMLDETPYALSDAAVLNIKNALKRFHFLSAGLDIPAGTVLMDTSENSFTSSLYVPLMTDDVLLYLEMKASASSICFSTHPVNSLRSMNSLLYSSTNAAILSD